VLVHDGHLFTTDVAGTTVTIDVVARQPGSFDYVADGTRATARYARGGDQVFVCADGRTYGFTDRTYAPAESAAAGADGRITAHSDGKIVAVHVQPGDMVTKGQTLVVLEAMKMEFQLATPVDGKVEAVSVAAGAQVKGRQLLVQVTPAAG
jgi:geranyl-CoA carboxylase alpha subunit